MNFEPRQFVANTSGGVSTVSLRTTGRDVTLYEDTGDIAASGVITLMNGGKYQTFGTWPGALTPGNMRAVFLCRAASQQDANNLAETLYDLAGRSGTLYAVEYTATGVATHTCSAAVASARPISMFDRVGAATGRQHAIQVEMVFDRINTWS